MTTQHPILPGFPGGDPIPQLFVRIDQFTPDSVRLMYQEGNRYHIRPSNWCWSSNTEIDQTVYKAIWEAGADLIYQLEGQPTARQLSFYTLKPIVDFLVDVADRFQSQYGGSDPVPQLRISLWLDTIELARDLDLGALTYGK